MLDLFQSMLVNAFEGVNLPFMVLMGLLFAWAIVEHGQAYARKEAASGLARVTPAILVSLGVLGTFIGIYKGLLGFDATSSDAIKESIPKLLDGLKTAFLTSIIGMASSTLLKFVQARYDSHLADENPETSDDPIVLLKAIRDSTDKLADVVEQVVRSDEEYSLLTQLKLTRHEIAEARRETSSLLREFLEKISEETTASLVMALEQAMEQFNALLNDMVGAAFDDLKESIDQLNTWQEQHRKAVAETHAQLRSAAEAFEKAAATLSQASESIQTLQEPLHQISVSVDTLAEDSGALAGSAQELRVQTQQLETFLKEIEALGVSARQVVPSLNTHLSEYTTKLEATVREQQRVASETASAVQNAVQASSEKLIALQNEQSQQLGTTINALEKGLDQTLNKSLEQLVGALAELSRRFVDDYRPLTERLREVVRLAEASRDG